MESFYIQVALLACDDVSVGFDDPILREKQAVEGLWQRGLSVRARKSYAISHEIKGFVLLADNVGKVGYVLGVFHF